jgi:hypothetical protein
VSFCNAAIQYFSDLSALRLWTREGLSIPHGLVHENNHSSLFKLINCCIVLNNIFLEYNKYIMAFSMMQSLTTFSRIHSSDSITYESAILKAHKLDFIYKYKY